METDPLCGNGVTEASEVCDDGNADNTDACLNTCVAASCGDGFVHTGVEECDDGNTTDGDGCSATCLVESSGTIGGGTAGGGTAGSTGGSGGGCSLIR